MTGTGGTATGPRRTAGPQPAAGLRDAASWDAPTNGCPALAVLRAMPKVELHLHLDCCLSYAAAAKRAPA